MSGLQTALDRAVEIARGETVISTSQTPIEVLLQVDEDGTVSTRNVYEFLGLESDNFTTWCKRNILDNEFAGETKIITKPFLRKGSYHLLVEIIKGF